MSKIDTYVNWMVDIANNPKHGYSQYNRWGVDYDCSSLVYKALEIAGIIPQLKINTGTYYTGTMYKDLTAAGFKNVTSSINLNTGSGLKRGDILLSVKYHVACFIGNGMIVHASIDEKGGIAGAQKGDQTGKEICTRTYYKYSRGWDYVLRYPESGTGGTTPTQPSGSYTVYKNINGYTSSDKAVKGVGATTTVKAGTYYVFNSVTGATNVTTKSGVPGSWIRNSDNVATTGNKYTVVKTIPGYTSSDKAIKNTGSTVTVKAGEYFIFNTNGTAINVTSKQGQAGSWINTKDNTNSVVETAFRVSTSGSDLNLRSSPNTSSKILKTLKNGSSVKATHRCSNGWYRDSSGGFYSGAYLTYVSGTSPSNLPVWN